MAQYCLSPAVQPWPGDAHEDINGQGYINGVGHTSHSHGNGNGKGLGHHKSVPEIDVAGAGIAIALLGGIVAIRRERRKHQ